MRGGTTAFHSGPLAEFFGPVVTACCQRLTEGSAQASRRQFPRLRRSAAAAIGARANNPSTFVPNTPFHAIEEFGRPAELFVSIVVFM
jgi:hypothetical protein